MRTLCLALTALFSLAAQAAPPSPTKASPIDWSKVERMLSGDVNKLPPDLIKNDWLDLLRNGCDLEKHKVRTPFEASALRNTPYALKGYAFKNMDLRALFKTDGAWYTPKDRTAPSFEPQVSACIAKIKKFEKANAAKWKAAFSKLDLFKNRMFQSRPAYLRIRAFNHDLGPGPVRMTPEPRSRGYTNMTTDVACTTCKTGLSSYKVVCLEMDECYVSQGAPADYEGPQ